MNALKIKMLKPHYLIFYFFIYSFLGWGLETVTFLAERGHYVSRGFIYGPFCIVYGFVMVLLIITLHPIEKNLFKYFILSCIFITIIEYSAGYYLELFFNNRWWDYSHITFNVNGYICLRNSIIWGVLSIVIIKYVHPLINKITENLIKRISSKSAIIITAFFIVNIIASIISHLK
jgi:uncharacterized membrane protein